MRPKARLSFAFGFVEGVEVLSVCTVVFIYPRSFAKKI
jgi:hypothetical protein